MDEPLYFADDQMPLEVLEVGKTSRKIKARGGALMAVEVIFKAGAVGAEHRHRHEQICYCLEGEFVFTLDGQPHVLHAGDSVYIPASVLHGTVCQRDGRLLDVFTPQREDFLNP